MAYTNKLFGTALLAMAAFAAPVGVAHAANPLNCPVTYSQLKSAVTMADAADSSGLNNHFWAVVTNRGGVICAVAFSGASTGSQWLQSRQIAAAKAYTADGLSLDLASGSTKGIGNGAGPLSTAQLYAFVQPSNSAKQNPLFGLNGGNVLDATAAYQGNAANFGTANDPMIGYRVGGTITFGGGLPLYSGTSLIGGLGLSGDTACADHSNAWRTRINLGMQSDGSDTLTFATDANQQNGHPHCPNDSGTQGVTPTATN